MLSLTVVVLGGLATAALVYLSRFHVYHTPLPGIPYNEAATRRLFGDVKEIGRAKNRRQWIYGQPRAHGAPVSQAFFFPFRRPTVIVSDYREAVDICSRRLKEFDRSDRNREFVGLTAPDFHFTMKAADPRLRPQKDLVRDLMSPGFLNEIAAPRVYEKASLLVKLWELKLAKAQGRPFVARENFYMATLDIITSVAFGIEAEKSVIGREIEQMETAEARPSANHPDQVVDYPTAPEDPEIDSLLDIPRMMAIAQTSPYPALSQHMALLKPRHARGWWYRRSLLRRLTTKSLEKLAHGGYDSRASALDHLLWREMNAAKKADRQPNYYSSLIRDEILGFILAGHDTSASVLSWWAKYMSTYQGVQHRLRDALVKAYPAARAEGRPPNVEEVTGVSVPYLDAVIEETLRYAAVITLMIRTATRDTQILGYNIPKGIDLWFPVTGPSMKEPALDIDESLRSQTSRDAGERVPPWGDDIGEYKPDRWLKRRAEDGEEMFDPLAGPTLAFSTGPRQCFGKKQAYLQLRTIIVLLIWNFELGQLEEELNGPEITPKMVNLPRDSYVKLTRV